jgi:hypothetical protein
MKRRYAFTFAVGSLLLLGSARPAFAAPTPPDLISWTKDGAYGGDLVLDYTSQPGHVLLTFSAAYANKGTGKLEVRGETQPDGHTKAYQRIYNDDGSFNEVLIGEFVFEGHGDHNHFHFANFAAYRLREYLPGRQVGAVIASSDKVGFAFWDVAPYNLSLPGAPAHRVYERPGPGDPMPLEGISVGWADVYERTLWDQWVDVTGVPPGQYWLELEVDPLNLVVEGNETNNKAYVHVHLLGSDDKGGVDSHGEQPDTGAPPPTTAHAVTPFPNPWNSQRHSGHPLAFQSIPAGDTLTIYTLSGEEVRTLQGTGADLVWDLRNGNGEFVSSGAYFYVVRSSGGISARGKVAVLR